MQKVLLKTALLIFLTLIFLIQSVYADGNTNGDSVGMIVNNKLISNAEKTIKNGDKILLPFQAVYEALGMSVDYDSGLRIMRGIGAGNIVTIQVGNKYARVNGTLTKMDSAPVIYNKVIYVSAGFATESTGATVKWQQDVKTVTVTGKTDTNDKSADKTADDAEAQKLAAELRKTKEQLIELKSDYGNWQDVILKIISDEKDNDKQMVSKLGKYFGYTGDTLLKMKYQLGSWPDVFENLLVEKMESNSCDEEIDTSNVGQMKFNIYDLGRADELSALCEESGDAVLRKVSTAGILEYARVRDIWENAIKGLHFNISIQEACENLGMSEDVFKKLEAQKFQDIEIYEIMLAARDYGKSVDEVTNDLRDMQITNSIYSSIDDRYDSRRLKNYYFYERKLRPIQPKKLDLKAKDIVDKNDIILTQEFNLTDSDKEKYEKHGFSDIVDFAKLKRFGITEDADLKKMLEFSQKYNVTLDKLNDLRLRNINWIQVEMQLKKENK